MWSLDEPADATPKLGCILEFGLDFPVRAVRFRPDTVRDTMVHTKLVERDVVSLRSSRQPAA